MVMKFRLRPEYANLRGGVLGYGSGKVCNVVEALQEGDGVISTEDPHLQQALSEYRGGHGLVFDVSTVVAGEESAVVSPPEPPSKTYRTPAEAAAQIAKGTAQHSDESGYALLPVAELEQIAQARGLTIEPDASKDSIIAIIEQHDAAAAAGTGE